MKSATTESASQLSVPSACPSAPHILSTQSAFVRCICKSLYEGLDLYSENCSLEHVSSPHMPLLCLESMEGALKHQNPT